MDEVEKEADLEKLLAQANELAVLFYSAWCPFCSAFLPVFGKYASRRPGNFICVRTDALPAAGDRHAIEVVPTVVVFRGGRAAKRLNGILGKGLTEAMLADFLKACGL